ncbi:MAG: hypothetical protein R3B99_05400 [Polyangiales bacterium]
MSEPLRELAPGVHVAEGPQSFYGLQLGGRMTVLETSEGLLVHSPIARPIEDVATRGEPRFVLAPNLFHHLHVGPWIDAGVATWAARGLPDKRRDVTFTGVVEPGVQPFGSDVVALPLTCFSFSNEVVLLHRPSRTLVVTDLCFHLTPEFGWGTRAAMWMLGGYPGCKTTVVERWGMKRELARRELGEIVAWDFDRLVLAHGEVIEKGGKDAFVGAFRWLGLS